MLGGLDDNWRPDRSKIMLRIEREGIVMEGLGSMGALLCKSASQFIATCIENDIAIFISIPGQVGDPATKLQLNPLLASASMRRRGAIMKELVKACEHGIPTAALPPMAPLNQLTR
jgi:hypothetical protein